MQQAIKQTLSAFFISWRTQFNSRPVISILLLVSIAGLTILFLMNLLYRQSTVDPQFLKWALIGGGVGALSTALGA
ncbi:MAG TPA: hypothetical protein DCE77_08295, partial [Methylophaga sp.]|nr:hypothetical protein [Methylophaga sp.]